ncbi:MAG: ABC transporter permease [Armatimonadetes bacterium]|nr:ABC transporter permease [Armatimonadota bacterium]
MGVEVRQAGSRPSLWEAVGRVVLNWLEELGAGTLLLFRVLVALARLRWEVRETLRQMDRAGVDSIPLVLLTGAFSGMVLAFQTARQLLAVGAEGFVGGLVAVSMAREAAPVFTAVTVAGRVGAGVTAELGTMKVTEQLDALEVMATDPVEYLVLPRVVALVGMLPVLVLLANAVGGLGGYVVALLTGVPGSVYLSSVREFLDFADVLKGLGKAAVFGAAIGLVACTKGMRTSGGAEGVGRATTSSVVTAIVLLLALNYFLDLLLF